MRSLTLEGRDREPIALLQQLIRICSYNPPGEEMAVAEALAQQARVWGLKAELRPLAEKRANLVISVPEERNGPLLLLCGHLDTVPPGQQRWEHEPLSGDLVDGVVHGRGAVDMKAGLVAMLAAMRALVENRPRLGGRVRLVGLVGEEVDCAGAKAFLAAGGMRDVKWMVVGEPTNLDVVTAHRGALWLELTAHGRTAHGSMPHLGINAIDHLYALLRGLRELRFDYTPHPMLAAPTVNVGTIQGGIKTNVVPDWCQATIDVRTLPGQRHDQIVDAVLSIASEIEEETPGLKLEVRVAQDVPAVETALDDPLVKATRAAVSTVLGREPGVRGATYFSDASILTPPTQVPTVILGPGDDRLAHQPNERVEVDQVIAAKQAYAVLARRLLG
jgi:succinyl-diaminopimelate desuccinylase